MELLNWTVEHPFLAWLWLALLASACHGLGKLGSTTIVHKHMKPDEEDE